MYFFKNLIQQRLNLLKKERCQSIDSYIKYLALLAHTGHIDIIHDLIFNKDVAFIRAHQEAFLLQPIYGHLIGLFDRVNMRYYPNSVLQLIINPQLFTDLELQESISKFFNQLEPAKATHEQNFVLNFLLNKAFDREVLNPHMSILILEYFIKAKNCNNYRKDFCIFSLVDYCQFNKYDSFFKMKEKFYSHIQKIYLKISTSILLSNDEQKQYIRIVSNQIKKINDIKRDKKCPKIAVCISGLYRNHQISLDTIKEKIILPTNADVFIHSWDQSSTWLGFGGSPYFHRVFGKQAPEVSLSEIHDLRHLSKYLPRTAQVLEKPVYKPFDGSIFKQILQPKKMEIENQDNFEMHLSETGEYTALRGSLNQIKMFHGIKRSIDMALEYSDYDYIIRLRPDVLIEKKLDLSVFENLNNNTVYATFYAVGLDDSEFVISSSMAYSLSRLIGEMFDVKKVSPYRAFPLYDSHNLFLLWLIENDYVFDKDLTVKRILTSSDAKNEVPLLHDSLKADFKKMDKQQQERFKPFVEFLDKNFC